MNSPAAVKLQYDEGTIPSLRCCCAQKPCKDALTPIIPLAFTNARGSNLWDALFKLPLCIGPAVEGSGPLIL